MGDRFQDIGKQPLTVFNVSNSNLTATGSEAAAIYWMNSITLTGSEIEGAFEWGVIIYQSTSGDSSGDDNINSDWGSEGGDVTFTASAQTLE